MTRHVLIYGANQSTEPLLEAARVAASHAHRHSDTVIVADRYGIEAEVMNTCQENGIPLLVIGTSVRPTSGISLRFYERALVDSTRKDIELRKYLMQKVPHVVVIGNTPDCKAMVAYARATKKVVAHYPNGLKPYVPIPVPEQRTYSKLTHHWTRENLDRWMMTHPNPTKEEWRFYLYPELATN